MSALLPVVTSYAVSVIPEEERYSRRSAFVYRIDVKRTSEHPPHTWGVYNRGACLSRSGRWDHEPLPSSRSDFWLKQHRFDLETALVLAQRWAPKVQINGKTAAEFVAWCAEQEPPDA